MFCDVKFYLILSKLCHSPSQIAPKNCVMITFLRKIAPNVIFKIVYKKKKCIQTVPSKTDHVSPKKETLLSSLN